MTTGRIKLISHDSHHNEEKFLQGFMDAEEVGQWGRMRFVSEEDLNHSFVSMSFLGDPRQQLIKSRMVSDAGKYLRETRGQPEILGGWYQLGQHQYLLPGDQSFTEGFNGTSGHIDTLLSQRHKLPEMVDLNRRIVVSCFSRRGAIYQITPQLSFTMTASGLSAWDSENMEWDLSAADTSVLECVIDNKDLLFNAPPTNYLPIKYPQSTSTDVYSYKSFLEKQNANPENFALLTDLYPVGTAFNLYEDYSTAFHQWTKTSSFSGSENATDKVFVLDRVRGVVHLNPEATEFPRSFYLSYHPEVMVQGHLRSAGEDVHLPREPFARVLDHQVGSYYYCIKEKDDLAPVLSLTSESMSLTGDTFSGAFYGQPPSLIQGRCFHPVTLKPLPGQTLRISNERGIGKIVGMRGTSMLIQSDPNGEFSFYYQPPSLLQAGVSGWSQTSSSLSLSSSHYFDTSLQDLYLYTVWKDDPLVGRDSTSAIEGEVEWDSVLMNGRHVIVHAYSTGMRNPVTNTAGAWAPVRPVAFTETSLTYATDLPGTDNKVAGYWVTGSREALFSISGQEFKILNQHTEQSQGNWFSGAFDYPLGWRLPGLVDPSSVLDGALYFTLNPLFGDHAILFEAGETANYQAGILDFEFELV